MNYIPLKIQSSITFFFIIVLAVCNKKPQDTKAEAMFFSRSTIGTDGALINQDLRFSQTLKTNMKFDSVVVRSVQQIVMHYI